MFATYMSTDTSTRLVKKKKTNTKELVKCLLGIVADLSSKVHRVLNKKYEPDTGFGDEGEEEAEEEEEEEMINEEKEETYYHGTPANYDVLGSHGLEGEARRTSTHVESLLDVGEHHTKTITLIGRPQQKRGVPWYQQTPFIVMQSTPKVKKITKTRKNKAVESPEKANEVIVNEESNDVSNQLLLDSVHAASTLSFWKEWSVISSNLNTKHRLHILPLDVEFWSSVQHIAIWIALLMKRWPANARWTIYPQEINLQLKKSFCYRHVASGIGGRPKWKDVDMVLFPINVVATHWLMAVLHLDT
uniref:Ubiquitin-like protease family profile domain-containing protein n=1 Tax=Lactuca sativa TaxID=4236 RepID=A0A9R1UL95_LACSA|nr:hypothetical protein LSAT_V11C800447330 [Lactuca sativa]